MASVRAWVLQHPLGAAVIFGLIFVGASAIRLGPDLWTVGGLVTLTLPLIVAVGFYVMLRATPRQP